MGAYARGEIVGVETIAIAGFTALSAYEKIQEGNSAAKAATQEGEYQITNAANDTVRQAGRLRSSFLSSGLTLDGGPLAAITQAFNAGNTNIARIAQNANNRSSNAMNAARSKALSTIASGAMGAMGGMGGGMFDASSAAGYSGSSTELNDFDWETSQGMGK